MRTLRTIPLLAKLLIPQELRVHASCGHIFGTLLLLDTVGVSLLCVVVGACILLLWYCLNNCEDKTNKRTSGETSKC